MKKSLVLFFLTSLILIACSGQEDFVFTGKSENWEVRYEVIQAEYPDEETSYRIVYIGEKPIPDKIVYEFDSITGKSSGEDTLNDTGVLESGGSSCNGCAKTKKDDRIDFSIDWEGNSETIVLTVK